MMKRKIAALLAAATVVTAWMPGLTLYAMEKEETGKKEETEAAHRIRTANTANSRSHVAF